MTNSIPTIEYSNYKVLDNMSKQQLSSRYWLPIEKKTNIASEDSIENLDLKFLLPEKARKTNNTHIIGISIAGATLFAAATVVFFLKGGSKGLTKNFKNLRDFLETKVQNAKLNNVEDTRLNRTYIYIIRKIDKFLGRREIINNFTSMKDIGFKHIMYSNKYTQKLHDSATRLFERLGRQTVVKSYNATKNTILDTKFSSMEINEQLIKRNPQNSEIIDKISSLNEDIISIYQKYFGSDARQQRYLKVKRDAQVLKQKLNTILKFFSKDSFNSFMAESVIAKDKQSLQKTVRSYRKELSYTIFDLTSEANEKLIQMSRSVTHKDIDKINSLRKLRVMISNMRKNGNLTDNNKKEILSALEEFKKFTNNSTDNHIHLEAKSLQELSESTDELIKLFTDYKPGKVEEILKSYQAVLSPQEYKKIEKLYKKGIKSLDDSIRLETDEFISKVRDLSLGSAPTDMLTILASFGTMTYYLIKSPDKQQRQSILLKYGIPALSGVGVSLYANAKLFAGTKSLFFGAISMWLVNKIGSWADKKLKAYQNKHNIPVSK